MCGSGLSLLLQQTPLKCLPTPSVDLEDPSDGGFHEFMVQYFPAASGLNLEGAALLQGQPLFLRPCTLSGYPLAISEFSSHIHNPSFSCFLLSGACATHPLFLFRDSGGALSHFADEDLGSGSLVDLSISMKQFWETQNPPYSLQNSFSGY